MVVGVLAQHDPGSHILAEHVVGDAGDHRLDHRRVGEQGLFDLAGHHVVAAPDDDVLGPSGDPEEAVVVDRAEVAAVEPPVPPGLPAGALFPVVLAWRLRSPAR